jgi:hypothetical protein
MNPVVASMRNAVDCVRVMPPTQAFERTRKHSNESEIEKKGEDPIVEGRVWRSLIDCEACGVACSLATWTDDV